MNIIIYFKGILSDPTGTPSSKRFIALLCTILMSTAFIANLFWGYKIDEFIFNAIMYVVIGSLGITGVEKFSPNMPEIDNTK